MGSGLSGGPLTGGPSLPTGSGPITASDGSAAAPSINFLSSLTTGFYRLAAGIVGFASAGVYSLELRSSGVMAGGLATLSLTTATGAIIGYNAVSLITAVPASVSFVVGSGTGPARFVGLGTLGTGAVTIPDATGTPGNVTQNSPRGRAAMAALATTCTVTNSECTANSVVMVTWESDPTGTRTWVVVNAGNFVVTVAAAPAGNVNFRYLVVQ